MISGKSAQLAKEAKERLAMAKATYNDANLPKEFWNYKRLMLKIWGKNLKNAAFELNKARLQLHLANERFNNTACTIKSIQSSECEIKEYTHV